LTDSGAKPQYRARSRNRSHKAKVRETNLFSPTVGFDGRP
jgi:hypothetical protein